MWLNVRAEEQLIPVNRKSKTLTAEVRFQTLFSRTTSRKPLPEKEMQSKKTPPVIHHCKHPGLWIVTVYAQFCFLCLHTGSSHKTMGYKPLRAFALLQKKLSEHRDEPVWLCLSLHAPHSTWRHWNNKHQLLHYLLQKSKEHICVYGPLVGFIQHDNGILGQIRIYEALPQQHPICHVFDDSLRAGAVLKSNGVANLDREIEQKLKLQNEVTNTINSQFDCSMFVLQTRKQTHNTLAPVLIFPTSRGYFGTSFSMETHLLSQAATKFFWHPLCNRHGSHSAGLSTSNLASWRVPCLSQVLGNLCCLPRSCLSNNNQNLIVMHSLEKVITDIHVNI